MVLNNLTAAECQNLDVSSRREWLLTNGIGGFAMGTPSGINTRRYHGLLVAAVDDQMSRYVALAGMEAFVEGNGPAVGISANQYVGAVFPEGHCYMESFRVGNWAEWEFRVGNNRVLKRVGLHNGENSVTVAYKNIGSKPIRLTLRPLVCDKFYHENFYESQNYPRLLAFPKAQTIVQGENTTLHITHEGARRAPVQGWYYRFEHFRELERGLPSRDDLFCPCELTYELAAGESAVIVASVQAQTAPFDFETQPWAPESPSFLVERGDTTTVIAGYPWFTDWGRDTMISLPGLCLASGKTEVAKKILRGYAHRMFQGLIPNRTVEAQGYQYNTVDATLWFANSIYLLLVQQWDAAFAKEMYDALQEAMDWHCGGTLHGIIVDPSDGLLRQGEEGVQLTWMDAKVGDWVVTPRHGKPVEISGLWINFLRIGEWMSQQLGEDPTPFADSAQLAESSFERKFWSKALGHYLDTADPDDASLRPNQLIAMSLPFGPATGPHAVRALEKVEKHLLTPYGVRTLSPTEAGYRGRFKGPLPELDSAYHQGTVWPWLLGPYCDAVLRLTGDRAKVQATLSKIGAMQQDYGIGGIAEVYDGDSPQRPGGCPWQAWSTAEVARIGALLAGRSIHNFSPKSGGKES